MRKPGFATRGFTLIELVIVIVTLGILAAVAIPRFVSLQSEARAASIRSITGSAASTLSMIYAKAVLAGLQQAPTANISIGGPPLIALKYGYPALASMPILFQFDPASQQFQIGTLGSTSGFVAPTNVKNTANCRVTYREASSATVPATIVATVTDCS
ncbi:MAG: prepilin-type N-terminal cleavage/methylation domain-containing protein [Herbaspirillum sp.]